MFGTMDPTMTMGAGDQAVLDQAAAARAARVVPAYQGPLIVWSGLALTNAINSAPQNMGVSMTTAQIDWLAVRSTLAVVGLASALGAGLGALVARNKKRAAVTGALIGSGVAMGYSALNFADTYWITSMAGTGQVSGGWLQNAKLAHWIVAAGLAGYGGYRLFRATGSKGRRS